jgi:hypothetical protein
MAPESWLVVTAGAGFVLLGIAASPLGWVAILHRRTRGERQAEGRFLALEKQIRALQARLELYESTGPAHRANGQESASSGGHLARSGRLPSVVARQGPPRVEYSPVLNPAEPRLISVPNLSATHDREATVSGLNQRYSAIWSLADTGASPDVIARATGQPIGQIELILGLRRQLEGGRTNIPHARHE